MGNPDLHLNKKGVDQPTHSQSGQVFCSQESMHGRIQRVGSTLPWKNTSCYMFLEILVWAPLEKELGPSGPVASHGKSL